jgi:hypothetical protein
MIYKLMAENSEFVLSRKVMAHLNEGFELYGNPFAVIEKPSSNDVALIIYCQAVIKREDETP